MSSLDEFLARHAIEAERHEHPAVMTVEESERLVPRLPGAKTKNLFLRDKKGLRHLKSRQRLSKVDFRIACPANF